MAARSSLARAERALESMIRCEESMGWKWGSRQTHLGCSRRRGTSSNGIGLGGVAPRSPASSVLVREQRREKERDRELREVCNLDTELGNGSRMVERLPATVAVASARRDPEAGRCELGWRWRLALGLRYDSMDIGACYLRGGAAWGTRQIPRRSGRRWILCRRNRVLHG